MKYYTKEWYRLMGSDDYTSGMKKILDKEYSDDEIQKFYDKALAKYISQDREEYYEFLDDSPDFETSEEDNFQPVKMKSQYRPPFDPKESIKNFETGYRNVIKYADEHFPQWVIKQVDLRLLALNLLPKSIFIRLREEEKRNRKEFNKMDKRAMRAVWEAESKLPDRISGNFGYHDACVLQLKKQGNDFNMMLLLDWGTFSEGKTPYERVAFLDGVLVERDKGIVIRARLIENKYYRSNCHMLYNELYLLDDGRYEVHMMVWCNELKYLTLQCRDIQFESNVNYPASKLV